MENLNQNICFAAIVGGEAFIKSGGGRRQEISNILESTEKKISLISNVWKDYIAAEQLCAIIFQNV